MEISYKMLLSLLALGVGVSGWLGVGVSGWLGVGVSGWLEVTKSGCLNGLLPIKCY